MDRDDDRGESRLETQMRMFGRVLWGERVLIATVVLSAFGLAAFAMWLLHKQREQAQLAQQQMQLGLFGPAQPAPSEARTLPAPAMLGAAQQVPQQHMQTAMLTLVVPSDRAQRLWQPPIQHGAPRYWTIRVRNIGPAGSFAIISTDSACAGINSVQIPAGIAGQHEFEISPSQVIYGRADRPGVEITLTASASR